MSTHHNNHRLRKGSNISTYQNKLGVTVIACKDHKSLLELLYSGAEVDDEMWEQLENAEKCKECKALLNGYDRSAEEQRPAAEEQKPEGTNGFFALLFTCLLNRKNRGLSLRRSATVNIFKNVILAPIVQLMIVGFILWPSMGGSKQKQQAENNEPFYTTTYLNIQNKIKILIKTKPLPLLQSAENIETVAPSLVSNHLKNNKIISYKSKSLPIRDPVVFIVSSHFSNFSNLLNNKDSEIISRKIQLAAHGRIPCCASKLQQIEELHWKVETNFSIDVETKNIITSTPLKLIDISADSCLEKNSKMLSFDVPDNAGIIEVTFHRRKNSKC